MISTRMAIHHWESAPDEPAIREHLDRFTRALATGNLEAAFALCPVYEGELKDPTDRAFYETYIGHAIFQFVDQQAAIEGEVYVADKPETWLRFVSPMSEISDDELGFEMPPRGEGEILANVALKGEVTDITGRWHVAEVDGRWHVCFSNFDIL